MVDTIVNTFNYLLGSHRTHIANAYPTPVCALIHKNTLTLSKVSIELLCKNIKHNRLSAAIELESQKTVTYMYITSGDFIRHINRSIEEYLSIYCLDLEHTKGNCLVGNMRIDVNRSFIIDNRGIVRPQMYGGDLWVDEYGHDHKP